MNPYKVLKELRESRGLNHEEAANMIGVERSYYTKIENGKRPSVEAAKRINHKFGINWTNFFEQNGDIISQK